MVMSKITFEEFVEQVYQFDKERGWTNLDPCDLAKSIMLEWAELLEHFQWDNTTKINWWDINTKNKKEIANEASDIFIFLLKFCRGMDIDLLESASKKLEKTKLKYPAWLWASDETEYQRIKQSYRNK